jgi:hypothetical protein
MPSGRQSAKRSVVIVARLITAVVSLAGAEGVLWFGGYPNWWAMDPAFGGGVAEYESDAYLGWKARQGQFTLVWADGSSGGHPFHYTNWSEGRRATSEQEPPRIPTRPQILFFGDSYMQGYGLSDSETLPWIVQQRHPELQVSNYGTGLYGTYQSYLAMRKQVRQPASVYYLFSAFHEDRNVGAPSFLRIMKKSPSGWFYPYAELSGGKLNEGRSEGEVMWPLSRHFRTVALVQDYDLIIKSYLRVREKRKATQTILVEMNDLVRSASGTFTVILFDMDPEERQAYRHFLESQRIAFVDCDRPERMDPKLRLPDGHPARKLNELLAGWIEPVATPTLQAASDQNQVVSGKLQ